MRVCKKFYFATLAISQKMVYSKHKKKDMISATNKTDGRGKHGKQCNGVSLLLIKKLLLDILILFEN